MTNNRSSNGDTVSRKQGIVIVFGVMIVMFLIVLSTAGFVLQEEPTSDFAIVTTDNETATIVPTGGNVTVSNLYVNGQSVEKIHGDDELAQDESFRVNIRNTERVIITTRSTVVFSEPVPE